VLAVAEAAQRTLCHLDVWPARAARDDLGRSSYRQDTSAASAIRRLTPLVTLIADWAGWS
jgi:hypothetical protein